MKNITVYITEALDVNNIYADAFQKSKDIVLNDYISKLSKIKGFPKIEKYTNDSDDNYVFFGSACTGVNHYSGNTSFYIYLKDDVEFDKIKTDIENTLKEIGCKYAIEEKYYMDDGGVRIYVNDNKLKKIQKEVDAYYDARYAKMLGGKKQNPSELIFILLTGFENAKEYVEFLNDDVEDTSAKNPKKLQSIIDTFVDSNNIKSIKSLKYDVQDDDEDIFSELKDRVGLKRFKKASIETVSYQWKSDNFSVGTKDNVLSAKIYYDAAPGNDGYFTVSIEA